MNKVLISYKYRIVISIHYTAYADNINNSPIEESVSGFTTFMQENAFSVFGKRRSQTRAPNANGQTSNTKWFNAECYNHRKDYKKARNLFLRNKSNENRQNFIHKKRTYNKTKRKFKFQFKIREGERIAKRAKSNSKSFWKNIKSQYRTKANDPEISINDLFTHFNGLYGLQTENTTNQEKYPQFRSLYDHDLDSPFTETEIRTAVFEQKKSKSSGTDNLISEVSKNSFDIIYPFLLSLFNKLLDSGIFPESWGEGIIVPIFKGGNLEAKNFRGITLNNIISKIYSKLLVNRLNKWSDKHQKIIDNQFGFQKGKSRVDCIFIIHALISKTLASKKKHYVAFLD